MRNSFLLLLACCLLISSSVLAAAQKVNQQSAASVKIARYFIQKLVRGEYSAAEALFDAKMKQAIPPGNLREIWLSVTGQAGSYQKELKMTVTKVGNDQVIILTSKFAKTVLNLQVAVNRTGKISGFYIKPSQTTGSSRPQTPRGPFSYVREEVAYRNRKTGGVLSGTLTIPRGSRPFPVVLLITGSGAQDRDETIMGHKPFLVLADYLSRRGIGVLRVDDRGAGASTGNAELATTADLATDVRAGVKYLSDRSDVREIGLLGHSEGGLIAPMVAVDSKEVAFVILLAGPGLPGDTLLKLQQAAILKANGVSAQTIKAEQRVQAEVVRIAKEVKNRADARKRLGETLTASYSCLDQAQKKAAGNREYFVKNQVKVMTSPWMKFFLNYDPRPVLGRLQCPVLALNGSKDTQVTPKENLAAIANALKKGGNHHYTVKELPGLNHLFQTASTGSPDEYGQISETMAPVVLKMVYNWITHRVSAGKTN